MKGSENRGLRVGENIPFFLASAYDSGCLVSQRQKLKLKLCFSENLKSSFTF